ncbi:hypothetical protein AMECASPLE_032476, partial [Ameca splendens]
RLDAVRLDGVRLNKSTATTTFLCRHYYFSLVIQPQRLLVDRCEPTFKTSGTGSVGKLCHRRSNHSIINNARGKSHPLLGKEKSSLNQNPFSSSVLHSSWRSSTLPWSSSTTPSCPQSTSASQSGEPHEMPNTALIRSGEKMFLLVGPDIAIKSYSSGGIL